MLVTEGTPDEFPSAFCSKPYPKASIKHDFPTTATLTDFGPLISIYQRTAQRRAAEAPRRWSLANPAALV
jgi:hypothetical protein